MRSDWPRPTPLEWLMLGTGLVLTIHYAWILDDAYVYFRYVDNFVDYGKGWVYNEGEYVEGYTSPLWLLLLTLLRGLGIDYWLIVRGIGVVAFAAFAYGLVVLDRDLSPGRGEGAARARLVNLPLLFLAPNYATLTYFTSGVESPLVQLSAVAYALFLVRPERRVAGACVALSPLIRPELVLAWALVLLLVWRRTRRPPWLAAALGVAFGGAWLAFRIVYYADLLPNTFYLKHEDLLPQGLLYLRQTLASYGVLPLAAASAAAVLALRTRGVALRGSERAAMLVVAGAIAAYFVWIGGDPRHHRYLAFSFCLAGCSLAGLAAHVLTTFAPSLRPGWIAAGGVAIALIFGSLYPPQLSAHPIRRDVRHTPVALINDAEWHRSQARLTPPAWSFAGLGHGRDETLLARRSRWRGGYDRFLSGDWCFEHYWSIHLGVVHGAGLTDAVLARTPAASARPAHKPALRDRARQLAALREAYPPWVGAFRRAVDEGVAPPWVAADLEALEQIERKIYNRHSPLENLRLALTPVAELSPAE